MIRRKRHLGRAHERQSVTLTDVSLVAPDGEIPRTVHDLLADKDRDGHRRIAPLDDHVLGESQDRLVQ